MKLKMTALQLSIIVCTRNRAELLRGALRGLAGQCIGAQSYEVLVVDNGSTDHTGEVVTELALEIPSLRYFHEDAPGLSRARNRGYMEARGKWVVYTDDDCCLPPQWLSEARKAIEKFDPELLGGPVYPFYDSPKPSWYLDRYSERSRGEQIRPLAPGEFFIGCNIFIRRDLFTRVGGFPIDLGMSGRRVAYGEETEFQDQVRRLAPDAVLLYVPGVFVFHLVRREQMTWRWLVQAFFGKGRDVHLSALRLHHEFPGPAAVLVDFFRTTLALVVDMTIRPWRRSRESYPKIGNYWFEHSSFYLRRLGRLWAQLRRVTRQDSYRVPG